MADYQRTPVPAAPVDPRDTRAPSAARPHGVDAESAAVVPTRTEATVAARRRVSRVARSALAISGLGIALWYWLQVKPEILDGFQKGPEEIESVIRDAVR